MTRSIVIETRTAFQLIFDIDWKDSLPMHHERHSFYSRQLTDALYTSLYDAPALGAALPNTISATGPLAETRRFKPTAHYQDGPQAEEAKTTI